VLLFLVHGGRALCSVGAMPAIWCSGLHSELSHVCSLVGWAGIAGTVRYRRGRERPSSCIAWASLGAERSELAVDLTLTESEATRAFIQSAAASCSSQPRRVPSVSLECS
jgi:hypothetical protein